jgi:hypothetical protein
MKKTLILLALCSTPAFADRPINYDPSCLDKPAALVKASNGNYSFTTLPNKTDCATHGEYYRVNVYSGNPKSGNEAIFHHDFTYMANAVTFKRQKDAYAAKWADEPNFYMHTELETISF